MLRKKKVSVNDDFVDGLKVAEEEKKKSSNHKAKILLFCLLGVMVLYAALVAVQSAAVNDHKNYEVAAYISSGNILKDTKITEQNVSELLRAVTRDSRTIPEDYITDPMLLVGQYAKKDIEHMEIICVSGFQLLIMSEGIENPVEVSFCVNNYDQVVGGILREGDRINLYVVRKEKSVSMSEEIISESIIKNTYITKSFTNTGMEVRREDKDNSNTPTTVFNVYIPMDKEESFHKAVIEGTLRVSKIIE